MGKLLTRWYKLFQEDDHAHSHREFSHTIMCCCKGRNIVVSRLYCAMDSSDLGLFLVWSDSLPSDIGSWRPQALFSLEAESIRVSNVKTSTMWAFYLTAWKAASSKSTRWLLAIPNLHSTLSRLDFSAAFCTWSIFSTIFLSIAI